MAFYTFASDRRNAELDATLVQVQSFFKELKENPEGAIAYRSEQETFAINIMRAIRDKQILLMEAGVGIGKTFGYLIPIFYTYNQMPSFRAIISTNSIDLQEQLLKDIESVSKMLGIEIKYGIAKGINNYACLREIEKIMGMYGVDSTTRQQMESLKTEIKRVKSSDKADLSEISEKEWKRVQLKNRGNCSRCNYSRICPYYKQQISLAESAIVITNHAWLAYHATNDKNNEIIKKSGLIVSDEGQAMASIIRSINEGTLSKSQIEDFIKEITTLLDYDYVRGTYRLNDNGRYDTTLLDGALSDLFININKSAFRNFSQSQRKMGDNGSVAVTDAGRIAFSFETDILKNIKTIVDELQKLKKKLAEVKSKKKIDDKTIQVLNAIYTIFADLLKGENSQNIYWADFYERYKLNIKFTPKSIQKMTEQLFFGNKDTAHVMVSGTLDGANDYNLIDRELELSEGAMNADRTIERAQPLGSPYNYEENALLYYDPTLPKPNKSKTYKEAIARKISELIRATEGKTLILFTSKQTMNDVFNILKKEDFPFKLLLQKDGNSAEVKESFINDTNSCLFATGAFWEGFNAPGPTVSQVIIPQLPFEPYDAVNQYLSKSNAYDEGSIHIPRMVMRFTQGEGRGIRTATDTCVVSCLDSRMPAYLGEIMKSSPITRVTTDMKDVYAFIDSKILVSDGIYKL